MRKLFYLGAAALALAVSAQPGRAQVAPKLGGSCTLNSLNFVSAVIGNIAKAPPITIPISMTCRVDRSLEYKWITQMGWSVGYCWHFHNFPLMFRYRNVRLNAPLSSKPAIYYNFYDKNGQRIGGDSGIQSGFANAMGFAEGGNGVYHIADSATMRFEGNEGANLEPGIYQFSSASSFHGGMTAVAPGRTPDPAVPSFFCGAERGPPNNNIPPPNIYAPQVTITPKINVSVKTYCNIRQPPKADFGKYAALKNVKPIEVPVNVDCSAGTIYRIKVNNGRHAEGAQRYMTLNGGSAPNGEKIAYSIGPESWSGIGNGTPAGITQMLTLSVDDQPTPPAGTYKDTLILTLERFAAPGDVYAYDYDGNDPRVHKLN